MRHALMRAGFSYVAGWRHGITPLLNYAFNVTDISVRAAGLLDTMPSLLFHCRRDTCQL